MAEFEFTPYQRPFSRWMGPFSPARGIRSGFRFHNNQFGTWVSNGSGLEFWTIEASAGVRSLTKLVKTEWGGGRVLLLPNGLVIKPLQARDEVAKRVLIGEFSGAIVLETPEGYSFDLSDAEDLEPGDEWLGPTTTGLECVIQKNGALVCSWYHPTKLGRQEETCVLLGPDKTLAAGFRMCRPGDSVGRVRVTAQGLVISNRKMPDGSWKTFYVGRLDRWPHEDDWIS